jgi:hypothetical protein
LFEYDGEVTLCDTDEILGRMTALHARVQQAGAAERREALVGLADNLSKAFYGFDPDFLHQNVARIVDEVMSIFRGTLELWPTLVEICHFHKYRCELPVVRVKNRDPL